MARCQPQQLGSQVMLGVFTSGLTQQYIIGGSGARQLATLKRYLKQNNVAWRWGPYTI
jgi:hypothetical protein